MYMPWGVRRADVAWAVYATDFDVASSLGPSQFDHQTSVCKFWRGSLKPHCIIPSVFAIQSDEQLEDPTTENGITANTVPVSTDGLVYRCGLRYSKLSRGLPGWLAPSLSHLIEFIHEGGANLN